MTRKVAIDSSCLVAAVCAWHDHYTATARAVEDAFRGRVIIAGHSLIEAYSVLTRLPSPNRVAPSDAWNMLDASFVHRATIVAHAPTDYADLLARASGQMISGGRIYDEVIADCVRRHADVLMTLNPRHFDPPPAGMRILDPRADARLLT